MAIFKNTSYVCVVFLLVILSSYNLSFAQTTNMNAEALPVEPSDQDAEIREFSNSVYSLVRQQWSALPRSDRTNLTARVRVHLLPDGTVENFVLEESSGSPPYDASVLSAMRKIAKFPKPPIAELQELFVQFNYNEMAKR